MRFNNIKNKFIKMYNIDIKLFISLDLKSKGKLKIKKKIPLVKAIAARSKRNPERKMVEISPADAIFSSL